MKLIAALAAVLMLATPTVYAQQAVPGEQQMLPTSPIPVPIRTAPPLTPETINAAPLETIQPTLELEQTAPLVAVPDGAQQTVIVAGPKLPNPSIVRLQILLDRFGASPGVIDGYDGDNVRKAIVAFQLMTGLQPDGVLTSQTLAAISSPEPVIGTYVITSEDAADIVSAIPSDYAEMAQLKYLGYTSVAEKLSERFHMDIDFLKALNPRSEFSPGETIFAASVGPNRVGIVTRIEADKNLRQVRAYSADNMLVAAYPATIGSEDNPSPSGVHTVDAIAPNPTYTYNPKINFQQGNNTSVLTIPAGPNGPVGTMWIDLSEPTFGIHGTPQPSLIDKVGSHGCVRLTNWDAEELSQLVQKGAIVQFLP